jgi:Flp pilus assembly protein TadG
VIGVVQLPRPAAPQGDGARTERGSVTVFLAIAALGLLALAGLVVDGGAKVRAVQRADRVAAEAARAAGQAVDVGRVLQGQAVRVDRRAAMAAATGYLRTAGIEGSTELVGGGTSIAVTTTTTAPTVFLGLICIPRFTVTGAAEVALVHSTPGVVP